MSMVRWAAVAVWALVASVQVSAQAHAQETAGDYPNRPVTLVVPFAPGGSTGLIARILADKLEKRLGKPFVVDHRAGGGGVIGVTQVAHGTPDGYTIMMASSTALAINVNVRKQLPYDPRKDITPIALLARMPYVLVVNPDLPVQSVADLVKLAREKPGQLSFASVGPGTIHHQRRDVQEHLRHQCGSRAVQGQRASVAGYRRRPCAVHVRRCAAGKLRALGVTTLERVEALPDVPPLTEVGVPGYNTASWHSISTTAGVPKEIVEVRKLLLAEGAIPQISPPPEEFKKFVDSEIVRWGALVDKAGILHSQ
jgi:tripartite-type tricarboxylate transporter receptor subunit TctC